MGSLNGKTILLGVTGSIAAYKSCLLLRELMQRGADVEVLMSQGATHFVTPLTFEALSKKVVRTGALEVDAGRIPHVEQAYAADAFVIAPCSADALAKIAAGFGDEAIYATLLSYDGPLFIAPAMESKMWNHPAVRENVRVLRERGAIIIDPAAGALASGREGQGRLAEIGEIVGTVEAGIGATNKLAGKRVLITAGPTIEDLDPVRFLSNRSTGRMGMALARACLAEGASVDLVHGPIHLTPPSGARCHRVTSAAQMAEITFGLVDVGVDACILAAAVADYRPQEVAAQKIKKTGGTLVLELERTTDILASLGSKRPRPVLVGFAAESENVEVNARRKLEKKGCDIICANDITGNTGFASADNDITLYFANGKSLALGQHDKLTLAASIVSHLAELL